MTDPGIFLHVVGSVSVHPAMRLASVGPALGSSKRIYHPMTLLGCRVRVLLSRSLLRNSQRSTHTVVVLVGSVSSRPLCH
jgi:hypothetical protein